MEYDVDDRRVHWMIFISTLVGMVLIALVCTVFMHTVRDNRGVYEISRRAKYEACQSLENEVARTACMNGWGN